jgi:aryl carrier-like protein
VRTRVERVAADAREGELLLGGACLADGYIGQPELSAARFVEIDGERWYRTGDRVRFNSAGEFEYLGRLDDQIKIAGHRVEPAEIETVLCRHSAVAQAAVVAEERRGGRRLVAHVVPHGSIEPRVAEKVLAAYSAAALPEHLRPQAFRLHVALPTTTSGKIDRLALAQTEQPELPWDDAAPLRDQLLGLWQRLLGVDGLCVSANVFDFGARSLDVVQALTELRRRGHALSVAQVYEHPTISAQLELLSGQATAVDASVDTRASRQRAAWARLAGARR